jgi:hypothetical protein
MSRRRVAAVVLAAGLAAAPAAARQAPDPRAMSGVVLPVADVPAGTVSVRLIRGSFDQNIAGHPVEFLINGKSQSVTTNAEGRAVLSGLARGASVKVVAVVDGERLESQEAVIGESGFRIMLAATDPAAAARAEADRALAAGPAIKGTVTLSSSSQFVFELNDDVLSVFYLIEIGNSARSPVDIGGPLIFDLPVDARGASILQGSSKQATANGPRVTVTGPFAPGTTPVQVAYSLPTGGGSRRIVQRLPVTLEQVTVVTPHLDLKWTSKEIWNTDQVAGQGGQPLLVGRGGPVTAGQALDIEISGLPFRPAWPRNTALALAGLILAAGAWAGFLRPGRRPAA